jgi:hypothetical protein
MTFGRPGAIPEDYIKLDLPVPLPLTTEGSTAVEETSVAFFNATM